MKVGVVGVGYLGMHHARIYSELDGVELVGVADVDAERAREVASRYGTRAYDDYRDILAEADALSIVVPTTLHYPIAMECVRAGKDILVEKPITATVPEADQLIGAAEQENCILQVGHLERYNPGVVLISGLIRDPRLLEAVRLSPFTNRGCDIDVTLDLMVHDIDIVLSLVHSPIRSIKSFGFSLMTEMIDEARVWIEFENGAIASLASSRIAREKERKLRVFQEEKCLELDYIQSLVQVFTKDGAVDVMKPEYREPLREELRDFVRCVAEREQPKVSGIEGRNALSAVLEVNALMERCP